MEKRFKIKYNVISLFFLLMSLQNFATHIVGGEIYYDCLGGDNYKITLKLYRDCYNGLASFDAPATIFIFDSSGNFIDSVEANAFNPVVLTYPLNNPCLSPPSNVCVEEAVYEVMVNLPPLAGGYDLTYQRCCRNSTVLNISNPADIGTTYVTHIPDSVLAICNSSPRYNTFSPIFLCAGIPLAYDYSVTDPDGDSLHYELCEAYTGLDPACPILGAQAPGGCNPMAQPPPYSLVPYFAPYTNANPMSASQPLAVDPLTGLMTVTPNMLGQWVIAVCVSEYRNGLLLSVNKRDFQFNVVDCSVFVEANPVQQPFCFGSPTNFTQNSVNAFSYYWDFGDTTTNLDTVNFVSGTWTYSDTGTYTVTLIVNAGTICSDTADFQVTVNPAPVVSLALNIDTVCSNAGLYTLAGGLPSGGIYTGTGVSGYSFDPLTAGGGIHTIVYTYTDTNGCSYNDSEQLLVEICTGQNELFDPEFPIIIFPNPNRGMFKTRINLERDPQDSQYGIDIYNVWGEKVYSFTGTKKQPEILIDLNSPPLGIYFLHLKTKQINTAKKIIVSAD